jgi:hypothetical protein
MRPGRPPEKSEDGLATITAASSAAQRPLRRSRCIIIIER